MTGSADSSESLSPREAECIDQAISTAVRLAVRGHGHVEPNPMVGCVILASDGREVGRGHHRRLGEAHAEVEALRHAASNARGATMVVTLEPCRHHGRTPPCTDAIIRAGVARVIYATADPNPIAGGGAAALREAGIVAMQRAHPSASALNAPFVHRVTTGLPWVSAKWAQTIDGAIAAHGGASRWISSERLRRMVHRERGRVDAVLTGIGTVLADDPQLTPRGVTKRRTPMRVVFDPELTIPLEAALVASADRVPLLIAAHPEAITRRHDHAARLRERGVVLIEVEGPLHALLLILARDHGVSRLLVESGGGLLGALERENIINERWVVISPRLAGDPRAPRAIRGFEPATPDDMRRHTLAGAWQRGDEMVLLYRNLEGPRA
ncbi:MAG: bifunctional diaminohydroxyphosphoribosylaminopyrimidine deaminase/5-amino-6-(5-phosphoribosylamino)uracil reductase RibD [Phycisphaeraceae bacterium]|nr:bifunctional diaminohydroxyphosphoribosylaminopyrimidine deaminase/5-amino-6-(5-phosphoribosylamino)uracil reductase RibD [Phycisphaeraceae bacterium]